MKQRSSNYVIRRKQIFDEIYDLMDCDMTDEQIAKQIQDLQTELIEVDKILKIQNEM